MRSIPRPLRSLLATALVVTAAGAARAEGPVALRVATFNVEDLRTDDLRDPEHPRLRKVLTTLQRLRPDVVLINEIAYDQPGAPGWREGDEPGRNGERLAALLRQRAAAGLEPLRYRAVMVPSNTGIPSGLDLDDDGRVTERFPDPPGSAPDGAPGKQTPGGRAYGGDCFGFGTFPGQYAMAVLVREDLEVVRDQVRTWRLLRWADMPGALLPPGRDGQGAWYTPAELEHLRLSSKTHLVVPVRLPGGRVLHLLCSHPTPPAFDGPEGRNKRRNHDEIRLLRDIIDGADYLRDDAGAPGGLAPDAQFVILGDLNADPDEGASFQNPMGKFLLAHPRLNGAVAPRSDVAVSGLDPEDTSRFKLRVDYVLPSKGLEVRACGIWRAPEDELPSDHFPVWVDLVYP